MKINKKFVSLLLFLFITSFTCITIPKVFSEPNGLIFMEDMVEMRDGVRLYTRLYMPDLGEYPVILARTPYGIGTPTWFGGVPPDPADPTQWPHEVFNGYIYVLQDTRGNHFSEGVYRFAYDDINDGYDTIDWIANQDWCDGNIGVSGFSAPGVSAFLAAAEPHPNLKAIAPMASSGNLMSDICYDGGTWRGDMTLWGIGQTLSGLSMSHLQTVVPIEEQPNIPFHMYQTLQIYLDLTSHLPWHNPMLPDWPDNYPNATGSEWWMHPSMYNMDYSYNLLQPYGNEVVSHPNEDDWRNHYKVYDDVTVPTLLLTSWYDFFPKSQIDALVDLQSRDVPVKILVGPGNHADTWLTWGATFHDDWFDYWLKGIDNNIMDEPPIQYYSLEADEWHYADQWPPEGVKFIDYYLHDNGLLNTEPCADDEMYDNYIYDPMDPVLTLGGTNLVLQPGSFDQSPVLAGRDDILSYTTPPLTEDVEITGPIEVTLSVSSNCTDTDFTAKLIDVHPSGELMLVTDGIIRARFRNSMAYPELMSGDPDDVYKVKIDIGNIGQVFKAGHCIRVDISSSNFPKHDRNLNTGGELYTETEMVLANNFIHHDEISPSYITLPLMPLIPNVFEGKLKLKLSDLDYKGPAEFHIYGEAVYIHFNEEWLKWDIKCHTDMGRVEHYSCKGELGNLKVIKVHSRSRTNVIAIGIQRCKIKVIFSGYA